MSDEEKEKSLNNIKNQFAAILAMRDQILAFIRDNEKDIIAIEERGPQTERDNQIVSVLCEFALSELYLNPEVRLEP